MSEFQLAGEEAVSLLLSSLVAHTEERAIVSEVVQHILTLIEVKQCLDEVVARVVATEEEAAERKRRSSASYIDDSLFASITHRFMSPKPSSSSSSSSAAAAAAANAVGVAATKPTIHAHVSFPVFKELLEEHEERLQSNVIMYKPPPRTPRTPKALAIREPLLVLANQHGFECKAAGEEEEEKENKRGKTKSAQAARRATTSTPRGVKSRHIIVNVPPAATATAAVKVAHVEHFPMKPTHLRPSSSGSIRINNSSGSSRAARFNFTSKVDQDISNSVPAASEGEAAAIFDALFQEASFANTNTNSFFQCVFSPPPSAPAPPSSPSPLTSASIPVSSSFTASTAAPASASSTRGLNQSPFLPRSLVSNLHRTYGTKPTPKHEAVPNPRRDIL